MQQIVISVEVNLHWIKEQEEKGEVPFSKVQAMLMELYPNLKIEVTGNKMEIKKVESSQNAAVRKQIKGFFLTNYNMSIADGDYNLSARVTPVEDCDEEAKDAKLPQKSRQEEKSHEEAHDKEEQGVKLPAKKQDEIPSSEDNSPVEEETKKKVSYMEMPDLEKFLTEYDVILKKAKKYNLPDIAWSTNVLLSMDAGFGVSTVNERIAEVLERNGYHFSSKTQKQVVEYVIPGEHELAEKYWDAMLADIDRHYKEEKHAGKRNSNIPFVFCIDLSECMGGVNEKKIHENLLKLAKIKGSFLFVFRIPYVEAVALNKMYEVLADMFMIRKVVISPLSTDVMITYLKSQLEEKQIRIEDDVDELLDKLISMEKQDGHFSGFKAINRLVTDIIYNKLAFAGAEDELVLSRDDLVKIYSLHDEDEENPSVALAELCGMENVKQTIEEIVAQIQLYKELKKEGKKLSAPTMHMRFVGNPGTGKTTVARLVAQIFREKGILNKGYFYEIKARDLCGRYVGETAPKTSKYCKDALGSVLFIDEAYTLYRGKGTADYGQEAIDTLITEMENNRDNLVVIFAGYKEEMDELLKSNAGLASRVPYEIVFRNYTKEELVDIFYKMLGNNFSYTDGFDQAVREFIDSIPDAALEDSQFSNARMIRNLYERIWSKAAYRRSVSDSNEIMLIEDDVRMAIADDEFRQLLQDKTKKRIGF